MQDRKGGRLKFLGLRIGGLGLRVQDLGLKICRRVWDLGFRVLRSRVQGLRSKVEGENGSGFLRVGGPIDPGATRGVEGDFGDHFQKLFRSYFENSTGFCRDLRFTLKP